MKIKSARLSTALLLSERVLSPADARSYRFVRAGASRTSPGFRLVARGWAIFLEIAARLTRRRQAIFGAFPDHQLGDWHRQISRYQAASETPLCAHRQGLYVSAIPSPRL